MKILDGRTGIRAISNEQGQCDRCAGLVSPAYSGPEKQVAVLESSNARRQDHRPIRLCHECLVDLANEVFEAS